MTATELHDLRERPDSGRAYDALLDHLRRVGALEQVMGLLNWDQEVMMPRTGAAQRAEQAGAVAAALHALQADPRIPDWCADAAPADATARANVAEALRLHSRAVRLPAALAADLARATSMAETVWERARADAAFAAFSPALAEVVRLKRAEAACLSPAGADPYDALLDEHEPGMTAARLEAIFAVLRPGLRRLRERVAAAGRTAPRLAGTFPDAAQMALARRVAGLFGYDWEAGRLDLAPHPSSNGTRGDVRITTRINPAAPLECLLATVHEVGHALYEQGLPDGLGFQPAGASVSMGVHEAVSRLLENQVGRGRAFAEWLYPAMREAFGPIGVDGPEGLWRAANAIVPGFIRTEADVLHYDLHVMLRVDLERALIAGDLAVEDLEAAWNERFAADFGRPVPDAARGVLQDVHWSAGAFGYFPTYTLGNVYGATLGGAIRAAFPDVDDRIAAGDMAALTGWLRERVFAQGRLRPPAAVVETAAGAPAEPKALLAALEAKVDALLGAG